jgi:PmbA protein
VTGTLAINDPERLQDQLADLAERSVAEAVANGATAAESGASSSGGLSVTVRMGEVETVEHIRDKALGLTVYVGHKKGSASTSDFSPQAVSETVRAACSIARLTGDDEHHGLAPAERMATVFPDLDLRHPWHIKPADAIALALEAETSARETHTLITNSDGATVGTHETVHAYANSHGFVGRKLGTRHSLSCTVIAENESGMQRDYWYDTNRDATAMMDAAKLGQRAAERAVSRLSPRRVDTGTFPVLFAAEVAGSLFGHFIGAIRGGSLYRKASFLLDKLGESVFPAGFRIYEQPHLLRGSSSSAFDNDGVATYNRDIVSDGVLQGYVLDAYGARRLGLESTANAGGVRNLSIGCGDKDLPALLREMDRGLLVTEMMGMGVSTITGDYSRGAAGHWVENGELAFPVEEITIASNLSDMFRNIAAVGSDVDTRGNTRTGSVLVSAMTIAGD